MNLQRKWIKRTGGLLSSYELTLLANLFKQMLILFLNSYMLFPICSSVLTELNTSASNYLFCIVFSQFLVQKHSSIGKNKHQRETNA